MRYILLVFMLFINPGCDYAPTEHSHDHTHDDIIHNHDYSDINHNHDDLSDNVATSYCVQTYRNIADIENYPTRYVTYCYQTINSVSDCYIDINEQPQNSNFDPISWTMTYQTCDELCLATNLNAQSMSELTEGYESSCEVVY